MLRFLKSGNNRTQLYSDFPDIVTTELSASENVANHDYPNLNSNNKYGRVHQTFIWLIQLIPIHLRSKFFYNYTAKSV